MKIRFAVTPPAAALTVDAFPRYLEACETLGFDTLWLSDIPLGRLGDPVLWLARAAALTTRLKLGANLVPLGRHPLWLAKQLAQLDGDSNGRLLLSFVPGLGDATEQAALGVTNVHRGDAVEAMMALMRRLWAGETVTDSCGEYAFDGVRLHPLPQQQPLEIWLGGKGAAALARVARAADGWLTSAATPAETARGCRAILDQAREHSRDIDPEHFGISMPFAFGDGPPEVLESLRRRRRDRDLDGIVTQDLAGLRDLVSAHIDGGVSKFVLRPLDAMATTCDWHDELARLADGLLDLQT